MNVDTKSSSDYKTKPYVSNINKVQQNPPIKSYSSSQPPSKYESSSKYEAPLDDRKD